MKIAKSKYPKHEYPQANKISNALICSIYIIHQLWNLKLYIPIEYLCYYTTMCFCTFRKRNICVVQCQLSFLNPPLQYVIKHFYNLSSL